jgi:predicted ABC-type ATPase
MPELRVIVGANGSGKTTFTDLLSTENSVLFNFNLAELKAIKQYPDLRNNLNDLLKVQLDRSVDYALSTKANITIVTNYNNLQVGPINEVIEKINSAGYSSRMIHLHLNSIEESMIRVKYREAEGGRETAADKMTRNFTECPENVKRNINRFDFAHIIDNSTDKVTPKLIVDVEKGRVINSDLDQNNRAGVSKIIDQLNSSINMARKP